MPLSEKARIEVYVPDLPQETYQNLLDALAQEFTYTFGGSTIMRWLDGRYLSRDGLQVQDRVHLIYTDTPFAFEEHFESLSRYADAVRDAAFEALEEEAILVVVLKIYHAECVGVCSEHGALKLAERIGFFAKARHDGSDSGGTTACGEPLAKHLLDESAGTLGGLHPRGWAGGWHRRRGEGEAWAPGGEGVERERMREGQTGISSPNMTREIRQARGAKQGGWLGDPRVDTPGPRRQEGSQADDGRVEQQSGLLRNPLPGKPCGAGGARGEGFASARGVPGHTGGKGSDPAWSMVGSGPSSAAAGARLGEETQALRATGGNAPVARRDGGD